ncbi:hypothetical protein DYBT9623_00455 [Dyadobacter sp. CECT 9623]|uniref:Uncharacterized protein n=2 Tax=Dyadobacter linearis TaxID=2823330 RepID=A0ABM8UK06_9BACT|nr:hypothetical protein DYBT9623_00455 [Dyadobacter sp. CECT 9623]
MIRQDFVGKLAERDGCSAFASFFMEKHTELPENGAQVKFRRGDEEEWREGEFDQENQLFIEIYSPEIVTHNSADIAEWVHLDIG